MYRTLSKSAGTHQVCTRRTMAFEVEPGKPVTFSFPWLDPMDISFACDLEIRWATRKAPKDKKVIAPFLSVTLKDDNAREHAAFIGKRLDSDSPDRLAHHVTLEREKRSEGFHVRFEAQNTPVKIWFRIPNGVFMSKRNGQLMSGRSGPNAPMAQARMEGNV
ncbi:hypothetical protein [Vibrio phage vB_pir03]|nr:hypothetical protein [Vibrio phage vB_pir03]